MVTDKETIRTKLIHRWIKEVCEANEKPELADKITWRWNKRMYSCAGQANLISKTIVLSRILYNRATLEQRKWLVIHEACHIVAGEQAKPHGREWRMAMTRAGAEVNRFHNIPTKYETSCPCGRRHTLSFKVIKAIRKGKCFVCVQCKENIKLCVDIENLFC